MAWMYHAYGKSATLSVTAPAPCGDPVGLPIGGEDGGSPRAGAVGGGSTGAGFGALATLGSSLSPGRGSAGVGVRSGSAALRDGRSRTGMSRTGGSSCAGGSSLGAAAGSFGRGGSTGSGRGTPTAATAGTRFTTQVLVGAVRQIVAPTTTPTMSTMCAIVESASGPNGTCKRRSA